MPNKKEPANVVIINVHILEIIHWPENLLYNYKPLVIVSFFLMKISEHYISIPSEWYLLLYLLQHLLIATQLQPLTRKTRPLLKPDVWMKMSENLWFTLSITTRLGWVYLGRGAEPE